MNTRRAPRPTRIRALDAVRATHPRSALSTRSTLAGLAGLSALVALLLTGCGISSTGPEGAGDPAVGANRSGAPTHDARLLFVGPYGLRYAARVAGSPVGPQEAVDLLLEGPTEAERRRGLVTLVPPMKGEVTATRAAPDRVELYLPVPVARLEQAAVSQLACTAAKAVDLDQTKVLVRVHERDIAAPWDLRCDASGSAYPAEVPKPAA